MNFLDFSDIRVLFIAIFFTILFILLSLVRKKSGYSLVLLLLYTAVLLFSLLGEVTFKNEYIHFLVDFIGIILSIVFFIVIDEIQIRRKIISQFFKRR